ncbi:hypothetical protein V8E51_007633 [Hyaloscypha variabilis]
MLNCPRVKMLDPLTSLSIACSVMQIISFSHEVTSIVKRIKKDGTADPELREHADNLSKSSDGLEQYLQSCDRKHLPKNQAELREIASKCLEISKEIQSKMDRIDSSRGVPVFRALKLKWRKGDFANLEQDMRKYQDTMQTHILVHLCNQTDAAALEKEAGFQKLDGILQIFIKTYAQGQAQLRNLISDEFWATQALISAANEATSRQIEAESHKTREHVTATQAAAESRREDEAQRQQLLDTLYDKDMNARRNQIEKRHTETFSWVFGEEIQRPWDSFTEWLSSKDSIYWICGKAGSGKSTLVKFLIDDERTSQWLYKWSPDCAIYSYFIWNSGTRIQGSILGLLRSLLYQIIEANDDILAHVLRKWPKVSRIRNPEDWSRDDLEEILVQSLSLHQNGVCIFLDGLDEIDPRDGPFDLLLLVERISSIPQSKGLKVCVSSRPEASFNRGLKTYPKLRLQDLTKYDVEVYTKDFVKTKCSFDFSGIDESQFTEEIVNKANGVFLWVSLALKSLQRGITNGDDPTKLMERLRALPSELGKLYEEMLKRLGDDQDLYSVDAAILFNIFILFSEIMRNMDDTRLNLFQYAVAFDPIVRDMLLKQKIPPSSTSLKKYLLEVDRKLTSRCAGILEVVSHLKGQADIEYILSRDCIRPWDPIGIEFLHRSAKDFLLSMKHKLLDQDPISAAERQFQLLQAIILEDYFPLEDRHRPENNAVMDIMVNSKLTLSNDQEVGLLKLIQEVYERNSWCEFYEVAARYGLHQPLVHLLESSPGDITPLRNYLLLCSITDYTVRTNTTVSLLLGKCGFSNNRVALIPMLMEDDNFFSPSVPLLGYFFTVVYPGVRQWQDKKSIEKMIALLLEAGVDLEEKFLYPTFGLSSSATHEKKHTVRPCYEDYSLNSENFDLLLEINCIELILIQFVGDDDFTPAEKLGMISRLGLDIERAHSKVLLYFHEDTVYGAEDEDSHTLNQILDWPPWRIHQEDTKDEEEKWQIKKQEKFEKVREVLKGKEVDDVKKWLTDRGHVLPEDSDVAAISDQASVFEMARIYERISKTVGYGRKM